MGSGALLFILMTWLRNEMKSYKRRVREIQQTRTYRILLHQWESAHIALGNERKGCMHARPRLELVDDHPLKGHPPD